MAEMVLRATGSKLKIISEIHVTSTQAQYDTCLFEFDKAWVGYTLRTAVFYSNQKNIKAMLLDAHNRCFIPWDAFGNSRYLYIGVYGSNGESYLPTQFVEVMYQPGANIDDHLYPPTPGIYEQIAASLSEITANIETRATQDALDEVTAKLAEKASSVDLDLLGVKVGSLAGGSPKGTYATVDALTAADPDHGSIYVVTADGKWYYWGGSSWTAGGVYQAIGLADNQVKSQNIDKAATVKMLLQESTSKRLPTQVPDNSVVAPSAYFYRFYNPSDGVIKSGNRYHFVFYTDLHDGAKNTMFRINARDASDAVTRTDHAQYLGDGMYAILDYVPPLATRYQLVVQNTTSNNLTIKKLIISQGGYPAIMEEQAELLSDLFFGATSHRLIGRNVTHYDGTTRVSTGRSTDDTFVVPVGQYISHDFAVPDLKLNQKYSFVFRTNVMDASKASNFRVSRRRNDAHVETIATKYIGYGLFAVLDYTVTTTDVYRMLAWNESGSEFVVYSMLVGIGGFPVGSIAPIDTNQYPMTPVWGHEYLYSWYKKIMDNQPIKMVWAGDSTTYSTSDPIYTRNMLGKKIMTLGGYPAASVTSINAGHGTQHTGNWLGGDKDEDKWTPDGFLAEDMAQNPDLYIIAYGVNDGSNGYFPELSWQERIDRFEANMEEGLTRIRGSVYSKSPDSMAIILCTPISTNGVGLQRPDRWGNHIRPIIQRLCRKHKCAFVDILARQYDHSFSNTWSMNGDYVHPNATANADYMSMFADLLYPLLLHK